MNKKDIVFIAALLCVCFLLLIPALSGTKSGGAAEVSVNGKTAVILSLDEDTVYTVANEYGTNIITVSEGKAYVSYADCRDGTCLSSKPIFRTGETIVCLPHRLSITIISSQYGKEIDAVTK